MKENIKILLKIISSSVLTIAGFILFFTLLFFKPYYKVIYNDNLIGYYKTIEDYNKTHNEVINQDSQEDLKVNKYLAEEPKFERVFVKTKFLKNIDNYILIENQLTKEYIIYSIKVNKEVKFYVQTNEEAEKLVKELKKDVKKSTEIIIEEFKTEDKSLVFDSKTITKTKSEVIKKYANTTSRSGTTRKTSNKKYIWPTTSTRITSRYGYRTHPTTGKYTLHSGLDIGVASNSPVFAVAAGTVTFAGWNGTYGYQVKIQHSNGIVTTYSHNSKVLVTKGQKVAQGYIIARSGSTGRSTGPHLHIEFIVNGKFKNPQNYL